MCVCECVCVCACVCVCVCVRVCACVCVTEQSRASISCQPGLTLVTVTPTHRSCHCVSHTLLLSQAVLTYPQNTASTAALSFFWSCCKHKLVQVRSANHHHHHHHHHPIITTILKNTIITIPITTLNITITADTDTFVIIS